MSGSESLRVAWRALLWSRLAILVVAAIAAAGPVATNAARFDDPALTQPLGGAGDALLSPLVRWDSVWFLRVADSGYPADERARAAFFPLYPLLVRGGGELVGGSRTALLLSAFGISLAALLGALVLLYRLVAVELGSRFAGPTLALTCAFPASFFFGAPYSESLFLLTSIGAFYAARTGHWAWAGLAAAAASGTRAAGVLLLIPLGLMYLYGPRANRPATPGPAALVPRHRLAPDALWLALAPAGLLAYAAYLAAAHGDAWLFASVQNLWGRELAGPLVGVRDAFVAAFEGARQLAHGSREPVFFDRAGGDPFRVAGTNLMLLATLGFSVWATVGVLRRLPIAYGAYLLAALLLAVSYPVGPQPLMSLPRFVAVLFPIFMWLALVCERRGATRRVVGAFAVVLGGFVTQYVGWWFVA